MLGLWSVGGRSKILPTFLDAGKCSQQNVWDDKIEDKILKTERGEQGWKFSYKWHVSLCHFHTIVVDFLW